MPNSTPKRPSTRRCPLIGVFGYNIYLMNLDSLDEGSHGSLKLRNRGLIAFAGLRF